MIERSSGSMGDPMITESHQPVNLGRTGSTSALRAQPAPSGMSSPIKLQDQSKPSNDPPLPAFEVLHEDQISLDLLPFLEPRDLLSIVQTSKAPREALSESQELRGALLSLMAPKVQNLEGFQAVLNEIPSLREDLRKEPLLALLNRSRSPSFPDGDRRAAVEAFASAAPDLLAAKVWTFEDFQVVLGKIPERPNDLQAKPLLTLGYRILRLHPTEVARAAAAFVTTVDNLDCQCLSETPKAAIDELRNAAAKTGRDERWDSLIECAKKAASADFDAGELIFILANRYGLNCIDHLESRSGAADKVRNGKSVEVVAKRHGIKDAYSIERENQTTHTFFSQRVFRLEEIAINEHAREKLRAGMSVDDVAKELGITSKLGKAALKKFADSEDFKHGAPRG